MEGYSTMRPTVAETTFQTIGTGLRQSQFVFRISKSIVRSEGFSVGVSGTPETDHIITNAFNCVKYL